MSRELLEYVGIDPDEPYELTPEDACGGAVLEVIKAHGGLPVGEAAVQSVLDVANFDLQRNGLEPTVDQAMYDRVAKYISGTPLLR